MARRQVVAALVDSLLEGVTSAMRPAFESAAVLRYFNVEGLSALLENGTAETLYGELRRWPFIRSRKEGLAVHDTMREMINEALQERAPERFRMLHVRAAAYYEAQMAKATGEGRERYVAERLYHGVCVDESSGVQLFQEIAEEFTRNRMANQLRALLNDVNTYSLGRENSQLWREYYNARLAHLDGKFMGAEEMYQTIGENERIEPKLRAYALCDWGDILRRKGQSRQVYSEEKAVRVLELSLNVGYPVDVKLAMSWLNLSYIYGSKAEWEKALFYLDEPRRFFTERHDPSGLLNVLDYERLLYWRQGNLRKTFDVEKEMWNIIISIGESPYRRTLIPPTWEWAWAGRYAESEREFRIVLEIAKSLQDQVSLVRRIRDLALYLALQGKCAEALAAAEESLSLGHSFGSEGETAVYSALLHYGIVCLKCGKLDRAVDYLTQSIKLGQRLNVDPALDAIPFYLGTIYEVLKEFEKAEHFYQLVQAEVYSLERNYFECGVLSGLVRVKYAQNNYPALLPLWVKAAQVAQQYEYNDHLTSLYLTRGYITWGGFIPEWESGFDSALHSYQLALIHALRFNRFLLDEALAGREEGTPLRPIIQYCLEHGKEGQRMLVALRDWWQSGINDNGTPRPDTISPIPEGIALLEAESIARKRELGDGSPQKNVVEQINAVLQ